MSMNNKLSRLQSPWPLVLITLASFSWFWIFRSNQWSGGDSEYWERLVHDGQWLRRRQMLSFAVMQAVHQLTNHLAGWSARLAINLTSCLFGVLSLLLAWLLLRDRAHPVWGFVVFASSGFTTLFYGHIETYAMPMAALLLHLLSIRYVLQGRWHVCFIPLTFSLTMAFHLIILFALPAFAVVCLVEGRKQKPDGRNWMMLVASTLPGVILWLIVRYTALGAGELVGQHMIAEPRLELLKRPWIILTQSWFHAEGNYLKWYYILWNGGLAGIVGLVFLLKYSRGLVSLFRPGPDHAAETGNHTGDRFDFYLFLYFACFMLHFLVWRPSSWKYDFDLFSFPFMLACLAAGLYLGKLPVRWIWLILMLAVNAYLFVSRPMTFAGIGRRETGSILMKSEPDVTEYTVMLDEWMKLDEENHFIPAGERRISSFVPGRAAEGESGGRQSLILDVKPDTSHTLLVGPGKLELVNTPIP
jgi:hypothetical protein